MKRVLSIVLILATVLSCVCFFAYAESENIMGVYNNYSYYCYGYVSLTSASMQIQYNNTGSTLKIEGFYNYHSTDGKTYTKYFRNTGKTNLLIQPVPPDFDYFSSLHPTFYIGSYAAATMSLSA